MTYVIPDPIIRSLKKPAITTQII